MSFGKRAVTFQSSDNSHLCFREGFSGWQRRHANITKLGIRIRQSNVRQRVVRVQLNRTLKVLDAFLEAFECPLVPEVSSFEIEPIRLSILGVSFSQSPFLRSA